jgi:hypothetical protein
MPAAKLPKKLHSRLDDLAVRVRKLRFLRAVSRAAFLLPVAALVAILIDGYLGLPGWLRFALLAGWLLLLVREVRNILRARTSQVDLEAIASAVEEEYPRLAERLTTAVELAECSDESNGAPALIDEVIHDADSRARKLDLATAFPRAGAVSAGVTALLVILVLLVPLFVAPRGGELTRRFFLPFYTPSKSVPYKVVVTSGDPAIKRGDPISLTAYVEPTRQDAQLPTAATLVVTANGKEERLAMTSNEANVWYARRPAAEADFDYRVEAGGAVSDTHHVFVVEPITLGAAHVTVNPPAYAVQGREDQRVEGLGELVALEHSTISFELRFVPRPASAVLEFAPAAEGDDRPKPNKQRFPLQVGTDGSATVAVPATKSGTFALIAEGDRGTKSEFPSQPLRVQKDEPPKLPRVSGLAEKARQVRPTERIVVECTATDDVALTALVLEWRVGDGPVQTLPLDVRGLPAAQVDGKVSLALNGKVKSGERLFCRLAATDNRSLPEAKLTPQTTYYPARERDMDQWSEFEIDPAAAPLAEQDIRQRKAEIEAKLREIESELKKEKGDTNLLGHGTRDGKPLNPDSQEKLKKTRDEVAETTAKLDDLARDVGVTPELGRMADALRGLADRQMREAEAALTRAKESPKAEDQNAQFKRAEKSIDEALQKVTELIKDNEKTAQERLDKKKLEDLARDQQDLADKAKTADPKESSDLAKRQKELEEQLKKLQETSEALKKSGAAARGEDLGKAAQEADRIAREMGELNQAMKQAEKDSAQERLAELKKKQEDLAKRAKDLAEKTDAASRVAQTSPLNPDDASQAKDALDKGDLDEAARQQEKARQELERLARDLEQAAANSKDPREAAKQLARLQDDLRGRLAQETRDKPLDQLPAERRSALEKQQEAIEKATARLPVPEGEADVAKTRAAADARDAKEMLKKGAEQGADKKMQETKESLEKLAEKLPTKEDRLARAKKDVAGMRQQQEGVQNKAEAAARTAEKEDLDSPETQRDLAWRMADAARTQAAIAEKATKLDTPGHEARKDKVADALQKAATDLTAGRAQDAAASQQAAKRELERLEQALSGQAPADEKAAELARQQRQVAVEAAKNAESPDRSTQNELSKRQGEIAREVEKLKTPEAASAHAEAADAAKKAEVASNSSVKADEFAKKAKEAADKLDELSRRVNGRESPADAAARLAKMQKDNADEQEKRQTDISTGQARRKAGQELEELKNLRPGENGQAAKQKAQEALQRSANILDPQTNAKAQRDAADALKDVADKLSRNQTAKNDTSPPDAADAAEKLAKKQKELAEQTKRETDQAKQMPGAEGTKARKEAIDKAAREQKELAKQANELPGTDSPKDRQQAQEAMGRAQDELAKNNAEGAIHKQKEAADALGRIAQKAQQNKQAQAEGENPGLPTKAQADAARELAEEQRRLQEEARKAGDELAKENTPRNDNPVGDLAKQQQEIARHAEELAKTVKDRQGAQAEQSKQARQAADAAKQTSSQVRDGDLNQAKQSGEQAAKAMEQMANDKTGGESRQKAKDLARQQADVNKKLDELAKTPGAGATQQAARQQQLEEQARDIGKKLDDLAKQAGSEPGSAGEKAKDAAGSAQRAGDKMQGARDAARKGQRDQANGAREGAVQSMEAAARQAADAARQMEGGDKGTGSPQAGKAMEQAKGQMGKAGEKLGQGQPGEAGQSMDKAAQSLQQAASSLGQGQGEGQPKPGQGVGGKNPGGNIGGPGGTLDLSGFPEDVKQYSGKAWGELPGEIKTKVINEMKARYGEDYARNIQLYFEQLAERK